MICFIDAEKDITASRPYGHPPTAIRVDGYTAQALD